MIRVPESHRVEKSFRVLVAKLQRPTRSRISSFVNARSGSVADAQNISNTFVNRVDIAKVHHVRRHRYFLPSRAAVIGTQDSAAGTAGPRDTFVDRAHAPQPRRYSACLQR